MTTKLLAIRIRRRSVATAVFAGRQLEYLETLHLSNDPEIVTDSIRRFLARIIEHFKPADAALGASRASQGERVKSLTQTTQEMLSSAGIPIWTVEDKSVLESFAMPKLKSKQQLRPIVQSFWPHLGYRQLSAYEAAALGLYIQVDRLLSHN
jgi:hypothetical protein